MHRDNGAAGCRLSSVWRGDETTREQYSSIDPVTGLREYGTGAINAAHDFGGAARRNLKYHTYWSRQGGYLSILVERKEGTPQITFRYHDIDGIDPDTDLAPIVHQETLKAL